MAELLGLAAACFLAATLVPLPSEGALLAYLHFNPEHTALAIAVATTPPVFVQIIGDAWGVAAGWVRVHWLGALGFMAAGRFARYLLVAYLS
jgi:membrane protein YqaA with SNARE-associated domain